MKLATTFAMLLEFLIFQMTACSSFGGEEINDEWTLRGCEPCLEDTRTCHVVSGSLTTQPPLPGYHLVARVPKGACHINVKEAKHTRNNIVLLTSTGIHVLRDSPEELRTVGTVFTFHQDRNNGYTVLATGPTMEPVDLIVIFHEANSGILYEYKLALENHTEVNSWKAGEVLQNSPINRPRWVLADWSECSVTCGEGMRTRVYICKERNSIQEGKCTKPPPLAHLELCFVHNCKGKEKKSFIQDMEKPAAATWLTEGSMVVQQYKQSPEEQWQVLEQSSAEINMKGIEQPGDSLNFREDHRMVEVPVRKNSHLHSDTKSIQRLKPSIYSTTKSLKKSFWTVKKQGTNKLSAFNQQSASQGRSIDQHISKLPWPTSLNRNARVWSKNEAEGKIGSRDNSLTLDIARGKEMWLNLGRGINFVYNFNSQKEKNINLFKNENKNLERFHTERMIKHREKRSSDYSEYDDDITPEEELMNIVKGNDPQEKKLAEIEKLFSREIKPDINYQGKDQDTPLHIAIRKKELKIIGLLLEKKARIDIVNSRKRSSLDIAKRLGREDIVELLQEHVQKVVMISEHGNDVNEKLYKFVEDFDYVYERTLSEFYQNMENQMEKSREWAKINKKLMEIGNIRQSEINASPILEIAFLKEVLLSSSISQMPNEVRYLTNQLYMFKEEPNRIKEMLIKSGIEIFANFESQFIHVKADGSWKKAMMRLAHDAVNRIVNYFEQNVDVEFSVSSITKGIILGKPNKQVPASSDFLAYSLQGEQPIELNTAQIFDAVGLIIAKDDGTGYKYYSKRDRLSNTAKYGYRHLFKWELGDKEEINAKYQEENPSENVYRYILKSDDELLGKLEREMCKEIKKVDSKLMEEWFVKNFQRESDQMKKYSEKHFTVLVEYVQNNLDKLMYYIQNNEDNIIKAFNKLRLTDEEQKESKYVQRASDSLDGQGFKKQEISDSLLTFERRPGTSGMSGQIYEIELLMWFLLQGINMRRSRQIEYFWMATNVKEAGDFDDIVFKYQYKDQNKLRNTKILFLQAKHREHPEKEKLTVDKLLSESEKGDFSLKKYFTSYRKIKEHFSKESADPIFGSNFEDTEIIIYTNAHSGFNLKNKLVTKVNLHGHDILHSKKVDYFYKISLDPNNAEEIMKKFQYSSDCRKLAKDLVEAVTSSKGVDVDKGVLRVYHDFLAKEIVEKSKLGEGKLRGSFLSDENKSNFKTAFLEEMKNKVEFTGKSGDEIKSYLSMKKIKLPSSFGNIKEKALKPMVPNDIVTMEEIKDFFNKLKLFVSQPDAEKLEDVLKNKIKMTYKVEENDIGTIFADVKGKVETWWKGGTSYITESNTFFEDSAKVSIWFDVKTPAKLFTGREQELSDLHNTIRQSSKKLTVISHMTSISGLGGIGKTELARQYIQKYSRDFYDNNVIWINAESKVTLVESFSRLAKDKLSISTTDANGKHKDIKSIVEEVYKFFNKRKSLFVFDNAEKTDFLSKFLPLYALTPDATKPCILFTSRNRELEKGIEVINLNELTLEDAIEFVKRGLNIVDQSEDENIKKLVEKIQRFPLAIQQAIAYIEDEKVTGDFSIKDYLEEYEKETKNLLDTDVFKGIDNDYARTTFTTWKITIDKISSDKSCGDLAIKVLNIIAYISPENVNRELFLDLAENDEKRLKSAIRLLVKYSMVNGENKQRTLSIHRLVQEVTRLELKGKGMEEEHLWNILDLFGGKLEEENADHAVSAWNHASKYNSLVKEFSILPSHIIKKLNERGRYEEAYVFADKALELLKTVLDEDHPDYLSTRNNMALVLQNLGKYQNALDIFEEVFQRRRKILGPENHDTLSTEYDMAETLDSLGKFEEALKIYRNILEVWRITLGKDHVFTLNTENNIAMILSHQDNYQEALEIYQRVYQKKSEILGFTHRDVLTTQNNMASVLSHLGRDEEAVKISEEVLQGRRDALGRDHPHTLSTQHSLALSLMNLGEYTEALNMFEDILQMQEKVLGNHPGTYRTLNSIAVSFSNLGKYEDAVISYTKVLEKQKSLLSPDHPMALQTKANMAFALDKQGKHQAALEIYREILEKLGPNLFSTSVIQGNMARVLHNQGKYEEALNILYKVFEKQHKMSPDNIYTTITQTNIGRVLKDLGKHKDALKAYQAVFDKRDILGTDHPRILTARYGIAEVLEEQNRYSEALEIFKEVYEQRKLKLGDNNPDTRATKEKIELLSERLLQSLRNVHVDVLPPTDCLPGTSHRAKREAESACIITWEDKDETNQQKEEFGELLKVRVDNNKFFNYMNNAPLGEQDHLIASAAPRPEMFMISKNTLIKNLNRLGITSNVIMHGMIAKNVVAGFINSDYQSIAVNIGFIAGGLGFAKIAEISSIRGVQLTSEGKLLIGRSLQVASPFLAHGASAFVVYDLINQVKGFEHGVPEAFVGIIGDSVYLGVDVIQIGIEIAETFGLLKGISSVTGPIGAAVGATVFVGTNIYMAVKAVHRTDIIIQLTREEKIVECLRAFVGLKPEDYLQELMQEKIVNNQLLKRGLELIKQHSYVQRYVFPAGKSLVDSCTEEPQDLTDCTNITSDGKCPATDVKPDSAECRGRFQLHLDNTAVLNRKRAGIKWIRAKPDNPSGGYLFCLPHGNYESGLDNVSYFCRSAIGVTDLSSNKTGNYTLIDLGKGSDYAEGFEDSPNIFMVKDGFKKYYGGSRDDMFILEGSKIKGYLSGRGGFNTLDISFFAPEEECIYAKLHLGRIEDCNNNTFLNVSGIHKFIGRKGRGEEVIVACNSVSNNIIFIDCQGGRPGTLDYILISEKDCVYEMQILLRSNTVIHNFALKGNFYYIIPQDHGSATIDFNNSTELLSNNIFTFLYEPADIQRVELRNSDAPNETLHVITIIFSSILDEEYNVTISAAPNPSYRLGEGAEIKIGNEGNWYILQNTNQSVENIISNYLVLANRLNKASFFIQSLPTNEAVAIGNENTELLFNNPLCRTHLVGNGSGHIYTIVFEGEILQIHKLPLPEVTIYEFNLRSSLNTLDLRYLVQGINKNFSTEIFQLQILNYENDLLLKGTANVELPTKDSSVNMKMGLEYFTVRLKDGLYWFKSIHVVLHKVPMEIKLYKDKWSLKPMPLKFKDEEIIVIKDDDIEQNNEIVVLRMIGNYTFLRDSDSDLMITNAFDNSIAENSLCTIVFSNFYKSPKMITLILKFSDKNVYLSDQIQEINTARDIDTMNEEYNNQVYNGIFNRTRSENNDVS